MSFGYIYKIVFPNGKHYIGLTTISLERRRSQHKCSAQNGDTNCLYNALRSYDMVDTFELIEIDTADTKDELCEKEIGYILEYNSYYMDGNGYNMTFGGDGLNGYVHTEEDNRKNSERRKKYYEENPEARKETSEALIKYFKNPEARQKNSEAQQKYNKEHPESGKEHGEKMKKYYEENPEAREEMSEIKKKYYEENTDAGKEHGETLKKYYEDNPEAREKCSEAQIKRFEVPGAREEQCIRMNKRFEDNPDLRQQMGEAQKKRFEDNPDERQKYSERMKKYYEENPDARRKLSDGKGLNKPFDVFAKDGTFIKTFTYQYDAKEYLQKEHHITSNIYISSVLNGDRKSSAGFVFRYK
jgi:hypothetical protein